MNLGVCLKLPHLTWQQGQPQSIDMIAALSLTLMNTGSTLPSGPCVQIMFWKNFIKKFRLTTHVQLVLSALFVFFPYFISFTKSEIVNLVNHQCLKCKMSRFNVSMSAWYAPCVPCVRSWRRLSDIKCQGSVSASQILASSCDIFSPSHHLLLTFNDVTMANYFPVELFFAVLHQVSFLVLV